MDIHIREARRSDITFMKEMLHEAVYWRSGLSRPSLEDALAIPWVGNALVDWQERVGDTGAIALAGSTPAGAAWFRFYTDANSIRGYFDETIPTLVIAVHRDYRRNGIGASLINWLIDRASEQEIQSISLMVSKHNHAAHLYRKCGFVEVADKGDSWLMLRTI